MLIGFVNGCFDTFHPGHEHLLRECVKQCDHLIVAINSDASVKRLKGPKRPVDSWAVRFLNVDEFLHGLGSYAIIPFEGDEGPLLMAIRPDILFKGYDHKAGQVYYRRIGWKKDPANAFEGPKVVQISHLPGFSTTSIVEERHETKSDA